MKDKILEKFNNNDIVINVKTREEYDNLMKYFEKLGFYWFDGPAPLEEDNFLDYKGKTCIEIFDNRLRYGDVPFFQSRCYEIISYQDFMNEMGVKKVNNKIKVIDLLNLLVTGDEEKLPKEISYDGYIWGYDYDGDYYAERARCNFIEYICSLEMLANYVEIIEEPVLDEKEKEYLSYVIKPFRDKVENIVKYDISDSEYIKIRFKNTEITAFPTFKKNTMYKGMKLGRDYTLEELGL